jgi:hypothetical protein
MEEEEEEEDDEDDAYKVLLERHFSEIPSRTLFTVGISTLGREGKTNDATSRCIYTNCV